MPRSPCFCLRFFRFVPANGSASRHFAGAGCGRALVVAESDVPPGGRCAALIQRRRDRRHLLFVAGQDARDRAGVILVVGSVQHHVVRDLVVVGRRRHEGGVFKERVVSLSKHGAQVRSSRRWQTCAERSKHTRGGGIVRRSFGAARVSYGHRIHVRALYATVSKSGPGQAPHLIGLADVQLTARRENNMLSKYAVVYCMFCGRACDLMLRIFN